MNKKFAITLLTMPMLVNSAYADDISPWSNVKISGFGTGALTMTNTDDAEFARPNQATGVKRDARTGVDSNLGLQADISINSIFSVAGQGLVRKDAEDDFGAELSLAFVKAKITDDLSVRVGRIFLPAFMISEYRNVGYANTMLRPPVELYSQVNINNIDGADIDYKKTFGEYNLSGQVGVGNSTIPSAGKAGAVYHVKAKSMTAINLSVENGPVLLRFGRVDTKISTSDWDASNALEDKLIQVGTAFQLPQLNALANQLSVKKSSKASFTSLGLGLNWKDIVVQSEYGKRKTTTFIGKSDAWYIMGGYRFGAFLPYYTHSNLKAHGTIINTVPAIPALATLSNIVESIRAPVVQSTDTIGVRWDFRSSMALKFQLDRVKPKDGAGKLLNAAPSFKGPVTVGAIALDFVF